MNNIKDFSDSNCTGCGICLKMCGKKAIVINKNKDGFFEAYVDNNLCVNCGACKKVCYKFFDDKSGYKITESDVYMGYSNDTKIRYVSSSGGIVYNLCKTAIESEYKVFGVKYNYKKNIAEHCIISNKDKLNNIIGSKYIQSYTANALEKIDKENKYIVIGSPCQIYGFRKYIDYMNLSDKFILVDFFCHGVPSYLLWNKYLNSNKISRLLPVKNINFRNKKTGWHKYSIEIIGDLKSYSKIHDDDLFFKFFLSDCCLNKCCYDCKLRFNKLYSDIRVGDFWGDLYKDDEKGTSIILVNSIKGKEFLNKVQAQLILQEVSYNDLLKSQYTAKLKISSKYNNVMKSLKTNVSLEQIYYKNLLIKDIKSLIGGVIPKKYKNNLKAILKKNK